MAMTGIVIKTDWLYASYVQMNHMCMCVCVLTSVWDPWGYQMDQTESECVCVCVCVVLNIILTFVWCACKVAVVAVWQYRKQSVNLSQN